MSEQPPQDTPDQKPWGQHVNEALNSSHQASFTSQAAASAQNLGIGDPENSSKRGRSRKPSLESVVVATITGAALAGIGAGVGANLDTPVNPPQAPSNIDVNTQPDGGVFTSQDYKDNDFTIYNPSPSPSPSDISAAVPDKSKGIPVPKQITASTSAPLESPDTH